MRVSSINSAGSYRLTSQNIIKQRKSLEQKAQPDTNVSFNGGRLASGLGMYGALLGFAFGGPLGAAILGSVGGVVGANTDESKYETDYYDHSSSSGNPADEALGVASWETY